MLDILPLGATKLDFFYFIQWKMEQTLDFFKFMVIITTNILLWRIISTMMIVLPVAEPLGVWQFLTVVL